MAAPIPERIGQYKIERKLGEGGMGAVYLGQHQLLKSRAAIKTILHSSMESEEAITRLIDEGQALASLAHDNIVRVMDMFAEGESHFLVMEYVEGQPLDSYLKKHTPDMQEALSLAIKAGEGIAAAHRKGILHRDIKPANVMITDTGVIKVMDFGLAKFADASTKTRTGHVVGTPRYMSPEQAMGRPLDARSDLYSFAVMVYRLVCGREPFTEGSSMAIVYKHVHEPPPTPTDWNPNLPLHLTDVILCALAKNPDERFQSMDQLLAELKIVYDEIAPLPSIAIQALDWRQDGGGRTPSAQRSAAHTPSASRPGVQSGSQPGMQSAGGPAPGRTPSRGMPTQPTPTGLRTAHPGAAPLPSGTRHQPAQPSAGYPAAPNAGQQSGSQAYQPSTSQPGMAYPPMAAPEKSKLGLALFLLFGFIGAAGAGGFLLYKSGMLAKLMGRGGTAASGATTGSMLGGLLPESAAAPPANEWVRITPPAGDPVQLGLDAESPDSDSTGFRPSKKVFAPTEPYDIQQHEVSFGEYDAWTKKRPEMVFLLPAWAPAQAEDRVRLPVGGIQWKMAQAYCADLGGGLPSEEQWEFAARGQARRLWPWGDAAPDATQTKSYQAEGSLPQPVANTAQDKTPDEKLPIYDLAGNVQEWTIDLWREPAAGGDESWVQTDKRTYRALRGLPFAASEEVKTPPSDGIAHRDNLCGEAECVEKFKHDRRYIGFRCVKPAG